MVCDGLQCFSKLKVAGKWLISLHHVAGPLHYMLQCRTLVTGCSNGPVMSQITGDALHYQHDCSLEQTVTEMDYMCIGPATWCEKLK